MLRGLSTLKYDFYRPQRSRSLVQPDAGDLQLQIEDCGSEICARNSIVVAAVFISSEFTSTCAMDLMCVVFVKLSLCVWLVEGQMCRFSGIAERYARRV